MLTIEKFTCPICGKQYEGSPQYTSLCKCNRCGRRWAAQNQSDKYRVCGDCIANKPKRCDCGGLYEDNIVWKKIPSDRDDSQITIPVWDANIVMKRIDSKSYRRFYIGETVVTEALWDAVMNARGGHTDSQKETPKTDISAKEVAEFFYELHERLNIQSDRRMLRLPSVREWLIAAWNGTNDYMPFAGSDDLNSVAIWGQQFNGHAQKPPFVKQKQPTAQGVYDLSGGVWEISVDSDCQRIYLMGGCSQSGRHACILPDVDIDKLYTNRSQIEQINSLSDETYKSDTVGFRLAAYSLLIEDKNELNIIY